METSRAYRATIRFLCVGSIGVLAAACSSSTDGDATSSTGYSSDALSWSAPPCGAVIGSFNGTNAYSNGSDTGSGYSCAGRGTYGLQYQCVELVMRYFKTHFGLSWSGNAAQLLANAPASSVTVHYNGSTTLPRAGDMIVWNNTAWGHVALVTGADSGHVYILEQNVWGAGGTATLPISSGRVHGPSGWGWADPAGWAHANANGAPPPPPPSNPCSNAQYGGAYCGQSTQYGFGPGTADVLYTCSNHAVSSQQKCAAGCEMMPPGQNDMCRPDPCAHAQYGGYYCGQSTQYGFGPGVSGWLYDCSNGVTVSHQVCASGCAMMPPGQNDRCN